MWMNLDACVREFDTLPYIIGKYAYWMKAEKFYKTDSIIISQAIEGILRKVYCFCGSLLHQQSIVEREILKIHCGIEFIFSQREFIMILNAFTHPDLIMMALILEIMFSSNRKSLCNKIIYISLLTFTCFFGVYCIECVAQKLSID